jgi:type VI secretion system protein ImpA
MDLEPFLVPVADGSTSGLELRNDPRFHAIERLTELAARSFRLENVKNGGIGSVNIDWQAVLDQSAQLAQVGRDLRLLVIVARALANRDGFDGLAQGLGLLTTTIERHWDNVHPTLREGTSPREAATRRINSLFQLENSDNGLLCDLDFSIVLTPRGIGAITVGDLCAGGMTRNQLQAEMPSGLGEREVSERVAQHEARANRVIAACRAEVVERPEHMAALVSAIETARAALFALESALTARVGENGVGVKFKELDKLLARALAPMAAALAQANLGTPAPEVKVMHEAAPATAAGLNGVHPASTAGGIPSSVNSRRDVERCLDMIIDFYERTEPSSPIPHLARRMRKMVPMNFLQLMEEIAPSGMKEFKNVAGVDDKKSAAQ